MNTINPYKSSKICLHYASNGLARPTSIRSALGMGKIMRDPTPHVAHGRKTLQICGSKIILFPAFDLKGFMLVLGNIVRPCQLRYMVSKH